MKKKLTTIFTALTLVVVLLATLCGCSSYGGIKSAFEKAGYKESANIEKYQAQIMEALNAKSEEEVEQLAKVHLFVKEKNFANFALIIEFNSTKEMNEMINESETLRGFAKDAQKSDLVNGNCILFLYDPLFPEAAETFKK